MKQLTKKDLAKIKYMRVISDNELLIFYKTFGSGEIIKGKIYREKLTFPEKYNMQLKGLNL